MSLRFSIGPTKFATLALGAASLVACSGIDNGPVAPGRIQTAAGGKGGAIMVTAADPPYGNQGETGKKVTVIGSGFLPGDQASWQRNGAPDPKIVVLSTQYVSSTELLATINIAVDAYLAFYDIAVTSPGRKGGIGTELFEVTQAIPITSAGRALGVNSRGETTGEDATGPFIWSPVTGLELINAPTFVGRGISEDGLTIAGHHDLSPEGDLAVVWTRSGTGWQQTTLPRDPSGISSGVFALASDPATGEASIVAGWELIPTGSRTTQFEPRLWIRGPQDWQRVVLPSSPGGTRGRAHDVNANGVVVGASNARAAVWEPNGSGGWTVTIVGPPSSYLAAVNTAGTLAVGPLGYWKRIGGSWSGPNALPSGCGNARAVDDLDRIVAICAKTKSFSTGAILVPPYSTSAIVFLGGLGDKSFSGVAEAITPQGDWIVGQAGLRRNGSSGSVATYWKVF